MAMYRMTTSSQKKIHTLPSRVRRVGTDTVLIIQRVSHVGIMLTLRLITQHCQAVRLILAECLAFKHHQRGYENSRSAFLYDI